MKEFQVKAMRHWNIDYLQLDKTTRNIQYILSITDIFMSYTISTAAYSKDAQEVFTVLLNIFRFTGIISLYYIAPKNFIVNEMSISLIVFFFSQPLEVLRQIKGELVLYEIELKAFHDHMRTLVI
jgi:hypothetical protein